LAIKQKYLAKANGQSTQSTEFQAQWQRQFDAIQQSGAVTEQTEEEKYQSWLADIEAAKGAADAAARLTQKFGRQAPAVVARSQNVAAHLKEKSGLIWEHIATVAIKKGISQAVWVEILNEAGMDFGFEDKR
jgi:hypothetical protein